MGNREVALQLGARARCRTAVPGALLAVARDVRHGDQVGFDLQGSSIEGAAHAWARVLALEGGGTVAVGGGDHFDVKVSGGAALTPILLRERSQKGA